MTDITIETGKGRKLVYHDPPGGEGWTSGNLSGVYVHVYVRPKRDGGGVFYKQGAAEDTDPRSYRHLHEVVTGEETVWFNNRLWTLTEEQQEVERIKENK